MIEEILIKKSKTGTSKRIVSYCNEEDYKNKHYSKIETVIPTMKNFRHEINVIYGQDHMPLREELNISGPKYFYRKTSTFEYHGNVCLKHIIVERNKSASYDIEYLTVNDQLLSNIDHGFKKRENCLYVGNGFKIFRKR